jgi:hypothetical protein
VGENEHEHGDDEQDSLTPREEEADNLELVFGSTDPWLPSHAPNGAPWCIWCEDAPAQGTLEIIDPDTGAPCGRADVLIHVCLPCGRKINGDLVDISEGIVFVFVRYGSRYGDEDDHIEWLT